jgi:hypothetical protein
MRGRVPRGTANSRGTGEAGGGGVPERGSGGWTSGLGFRRLRRSRWGNSWRKGSTWNSGSPAGGKGTEPVGMREVDGWLSDRDMFHVERARPGGEGWGPRRPGPADGGKTLRGRVPRGTRDLLRWEGQGVFRLGPWRWKRGFQAGACSTWNVLAGGNPARWSPLPGSGLAGSRCGLFGWAVPRGTCRPGGRDGRLQGRGPADAGRLLVGVFHVEQRACSAGCGMKGLSGQGVFHVERAAPVGRDGGPAGYRSVWRREGSSWACSTWNSGLPPGTFCPRFSRPAHDPHPVPLPEGEGSCPRLLPEVLLALGSSWPWVPPLSSREDVRQAS